MRASGEHVSCGGRTEVAPCVVHLVRYGNGPDPLSRFLESYRRHEAGLEHRLVLLFKGFSSTRAADPMRALAGDLVFDELFVSDAGFDLTAYRRAAESLRCERYCFLNSHSLIQADGWLARLDEALMSGGVGIAGASGSWASILSQALFVLGLPSAYRRVFDGRLDTVRQFRAIDQTRAENEGLSERRQLLNTAIALIPLLAGFRGFPAHHIRTNAFAITHHVLMHALDPDGRSKKEALRLESGRRSVTRTVERMGLEVVIVDRDGRSHRPSEWAESGVFWQGEQRGLLVGDNQSEQYRLADPARKLLLSRFAWGKDARPA